MKVYLIKIQSANARVELAVKKYKSETKLRKLGVMKEYTTREAMENSYEQVILFLCAHWYEHKLTTSSLEVKYEKYI